HLHRLVLSSFSSSSGDRLSLHSFPTRRSSDLLTGGPYPVRNLVQNVNDLKAQIAANEMGISALREMIGQFGLDVVDAYMGHVQRSEEHTSELQSRENLVCRLLLEKKKVLSHAT